MPRTLVVSDGFTSANAPSGGLASFTAVGVYASTAAYVSAKGSAAANGDCFINSSDDLFYYYVGGSWNSVVLPAASQQLTNKDIDGGTASNSRRITVPKDTLSNLQGLTRKEGTILYSTDQQAFYLDDGTDLRPLGGASGGTGISFLSNGTFDINDDGVSVYADTAADTPIDGTGGSANVTAARTTTDPLRGDGSLLFTKDAANRQGQGASIDFTLARGYRNARQKISFTYEVKSGTFVSGDDSDLRIFVYDVTNAEIITPLQTSIDSQSGVFKTTFDSTDSTSYRLIIHVATTSTDAFTVAFDDIEVGPNDVVLGPALSDWVEFTPTGSWDTNVTYSGFWRRVGDSMEAVVRILCSGAPNSVALTVNLPSGYDVDTNKISSTTATVANAVGWGLLLDSGTREYAAQVTYNSSSSVAVRATTDYAVTTNVVDHDSPFTFANNDEVNLFFRVPIQGWSTNTITANNRSFRLAETYSMTRVEGADPTKLGEYRSRRRDASASTWSETNGEPNETPTKADGFRAYDGNAWGTADTNNQPTRYEIFIGKNKSYRVEWYQNSGRSGACDASPFSTGTTDVGYLENYNPSTGVLTLSAQLLTRTNRTVHYSALQPTGFTAVDPYFDIFISDVPSIPLTRETQNSTEAVVNTASGYGSDTNNKIVKFTNVEIESGFVDFVQDAAEGDHFEILKDGVYSIFACINFSAGARDMGISLNSTQLTTTITSISQADRLAITRSPDEANTTGSVTVARRLSVGDLVRVHTDEGAIGSADDQCKFSIVRLGD